MGCELGRVTRIFEDYFVQSMDCLPNVSPLSASFYGLGAAGLEGPAQNVPVSVIHQDVDIEDQIKLLDFLND